MIDRRIEPYYDVMLSMFLGVILVLIINMMYDSHQSVVILSDDVENTTDIKCNGINYDHIV
jgi:hypothetical protein